MSSGAVTPTLYAFSNWADTKVRPSMIPKIWVVPIFLHTDQHIPTGKRWNTASPINHKKLLTPVQKMLMSQRVFVPSSKKYILSMQFLKPKIKPPVTRAGISGAKISPKAPIAL